MLGCYHLSTCQGDPWHKCQLNFSPPTCPPPEKGGCPPPAQQTLPVSPSGLVCTTHAPPLAMTGQVGGSDFGGAPQACCPSASQSFSHGVGVSSPVPGTGLFPQGCLGALAAGLEPLAIVALTSHLPQLLEGVRGPHCWGAQGQRVGRIQEGGLTPHRSEHPGPPFPVCRHVYRCEGWVRPERPLTRVEGGQLGTQHCL